MAIIIKDSSVILSTGNKLYRDALVSKGSLLLIDFSNLGGTNNYDISNGLPVYNLARDTGLVPYNAIMKTLKKMKLSEGKGFSSSSSDEIGLMNQANQLSGVLLPDKLAEYLTLNKNRSLHIFWMRRKTPSISNQNALMRSVNNSVVGSNYRINCSDTQAYVITVGGAVITTNARIDNELVQVAIEYIDDFTPPNVYINGVLSSNINIRPSNTNGFQIEQSAIGNYDSTNPTSNFMYRMVVEDLTVSGRTAQEVVSTDYNYVYGIGEYSHVLPRPFVSSI